DVVSAYVWRGITFNDGLVVQPYVDVAAGNGFAINVWGNYDIDDYDNTLLKYFLAAYNQPRRYEYEKN
ncbi:MAG TPA: hypothetical protein VKN73_00520, partial [Desulfosalsimonadaceae bacterium]|nr:hypothetical protein [Desulfosalsimonadaceae bacterium]